MMAKSKKPKAMDADNDDGDDDKKDMNMKYNTRNNNY